MLCSLGTSKWSILYNMELSEGLEQHIDVVCHHGTFNRDTEAYNNYFYCLST